MGAREVVSIAFNYIKIVPGSRQEVIISQKIGHSSEMRYITTPQMDLKSKKKGIAII